MVLGPLICNLWINSETQNPLSFLGVAPAMSSVPFRKFCLQTFVHAHRNLQAAIGAYYDFESPNISVPSMSFVEDVTIGEGESIPPDTQFIKTWRIQNSDVIWVILSVEVGGLLGVTQQLSSFETEFNTQPHRKVEGNFNPFASPQKNRQSDENNLKDPGGSEFDSISKNTWAPAPDQTEQDENRLSQNSVNLSPSSHANNLSVVTYSKGLHGPYPFGQS
uniref:Inflammation and lipid regulator with UBA-like and NBR1-like domains n=1 Tax=Ovis aries TaxID=9940 RepID=A0AC11CZ00_SHEEP